MTRFSLVHILTLFSHVLGVLLNCVVDALSTHCRLAMASGKFQRESGSAVRVPVVQLRTKQGLHAFYVVKKVVLSSLSGMAYHASMLNLTV